MFEFECSGCRLAGVVIDGDLWLRVNRRRQTQQTDDRQNEIMGAYDHGKTFTTKDAEGHEIESGITNHIESLRELLT